MSVRGDAGGAVRADVAPDWGGDVDGTRWLTYDALAAALGINPDSARRLVARRRWPKKPGNDGRALIAVPADRLPPDNLPDAPSDRGDIRADTTPDITPVVPPDTPDSPSPVHILQARVTELESDLRTERERSAGLLAVAEAERRHLAETRSDRDHWRAQAERLAARSWWSWRRSA